MAVIRFEPFRDPNRAAHLHGRNLGCVPRSACPWTSTAPKMAATTSRPTCPAWPLDSVEVTVEHSTLTIRAERTPHYGEGEQVIVAERPQGSFTRQLSLGEGVDSENLTASYADGVLHVTIPVSPKTQTRRVEITHAPGGSRTISGSTVEQGEAPAGSG